MKLPLFLKCLDMHRLYSLSLRASMTELRYSEVCAAAFVPQAVSFQGAEQRILKSVGTREKCLQTWPCRLVHLLETAPVLHWTE